MLKLCVQTHWWRALPQIFLRVSDSYYHWLNMFIMRLHSQYYITLKNCIRDKVLRRRFGDLSNCAVLVVQLN